MKLGVQDGEKVMTAIDSLVAGGAQGFVICTPDVRLGPAIVAKASGFVYHVAITGITGTKAADDKAVKEAVARLRRHTKLPVAVGFGIRTADQARAIGAHCDAIVVGSAIVDVIAKGVKTGGKVDAALSTKVLEFVKDLATGAHRAWP